MIRSFLKLVLSFAPWIAFLVVAQGSLLRLKVGLVLALLLSVVLSVAGIHRGIIMWVGLVFFVGATIAVLGFEHMWTIRHMGVLASGALALASWAGIAIGRPFTLDYARRETDPALWNHPAFLRSNVLITSVWASAFTANAALAWGKMNGFWLPSWGYEVVSYTLLIGAAAFTSWFSTQRRRG